MDALAPILKRLPYRGISNVSGPEQAMLTDGLVCLLVIPVLDGTISDTHVTVPGFSLRYADIPRYWYWYSRSNLMRYAWSAIMIGHYKKSTAAFFGGMTVRTPSFLFLLVISVGSSGKNSGWRIAAHLFNSKQACNNLEPGQSRLQSVEGDGALSQVPL